MCAARIQERGGACAVKHFAPKYQTLREPTEAELIDELVDGKQRLHCLVEFMTSQRPYRGVYWHELNRLDPHVFEDRTIPMLELQVGN